jgi:hypothetical protein
VSKNHDPIDALLVEAQLHGGQLDPALQQLLKSFADRLERLERATWPEEATTAKQRRKTLGVGMSLAEVEAFRKASKIAEPKILEKETKYLDITDLVPDPKAKPIPG